MCLWLICLFGLVGWLVLFCLDGSTLTHMWGGRGVQRQRRTTHTHTHNSQEAYEQEKLVALVLACTAHPARDVNAYTLPFWYHLAVAFDTYGETVCVCMYL